VTEARYPNMNNVRALNAQRPPNFECYASRARQIRSLSWKKRRRDGETDTAQIPRMMPLISTEICLSMSGGCGIAGLRFCHSKVGVSVVSAPLFAGM
jgi:hypothetical protein